MDVHHNPIIRGKGICDPHIHIFGNRAYLYASHDFSPNQSGYKMTDWVIFSSDNLVDWYPESVFRPEDTYIGSSTRCWAVDAAEKDGKYFYYFSQGQESTGVAISNHPGKNFRDALNRPLLDPSMSDTKPYDPAVFTDEDGTSYIIFGTPVWAGGDSYYIARLNEDMISLAEAPQKIILDDEADDKPFLHKHENLYYLSWASHYAVSKSVYGPYKYVGNTGASNDHGNFFTWNNQWFQSFTIYDPSQNYRASGLCYIHYRANGEMVADPMIVEYGVGAYDARWNQILAVWYMAGKGIRKEEYMNCHFVLVPSDGAYVSFPNICNIQEGAAMHFFASCTKPNGACIEIRDSTPDGSLLGTCNLYNTHSDNWQGFRVFHSSLKHIHKKMSLCFVFRGDGDNLCRLHWFKFS